MNIDDLINQIEDIIEEGKHPFGGSKVKVDADAIRSILNDIRVGLPDEVIKARQIASERKAILSQANDAAEVKIRQAEAQARKLVEDHEITKGAQLNAAEIIADLLRYDSLERAGPMHTASSAKRTCIAVASASECTATVLIPISRQALCMRKATSPRFAINTFSNM